MKSAAHQPNSDKLFHEILTLAKEGRSDEALAKLIKNEDALKKKNSKIQFSVHGMTPYDDLLFQILNLEEDDSKTTEILIETNKRIQELKKLKETKGNGAVLASMSMNYIERHKAHKKTLQQRLPEEGGSRIDLSSKSIKTKKQTLMRNTKENGHHSSVKEIGELGTGGAQKPERSINYLLGRTMNITPEEDEELEQQLEEIDLEKELEELVQQEQDLTSPVSPSKISAEKKHTNGVNDAHPGITSFDPKNAPTASQAATLPMPEEEIGSGPLSNNDIHNPQTQDYRDFDSQAAPSYQHQNGSHSSPKNGQSQTSSTSSSDIGSKRYDYKNLPTPRSPTEESQHNPESVTTESPEYLDELQLRADSEDENFEAYPKQKSDSQQSSTDDLLQFRSPTDSSSENLDPNSPYRSNQDLFRTAANGHNLSIPFEEYSDDEEELGPSTIQGHQDQETKLGSDLQFNPPRIPPQAISQNNNGNAIPVLVPDKTAPVKEPESKDLDLDLADLGNISQRSIGRQQKPIEYPEYPIGEQVQGSNMTIFIKHEYEILDNDSDAGQKLKMQGRHYNCKVYNGTYKTGIEEIKETLENMVISLLDEYKITKEELKELINVNKENGGISNKIKDQGYEKIKPNPLSLKLIKFSEAIQREARELGIMTGRNMTQELGLRSVFVFGLIGNEKFVEKFEKDNLWIDGIINPKTAKDFKKGIQDKKDEIIELKLSQTSGLSL